MFKIIRTGILLGLVCLISAYSLAQVYQKTKERIEAQSNPEIFLKELFTEGKRFEQKSMADQPYFLAYGPEDNLIGAAIPVSTAGYGGKVKMLVAVDSFGKVVNFQILEQNETPGLGAKITGPDFIRQFKGKTKEELILTRDDPKKGKIEGITAATISSRAVVKGIRKAISFFEDNLKQDYSD